MRELIKLLKDKNQKAQKWVDDNPGSFHTMFVLDEEYWINKGITTIAQFHRDNNEGFYSDYHKSLYGFRPRDVNYSTITDEELQAKCDELVAAGKREAEWQAEQDAKDEVKIQKLMKELSVDKETLKRWKVI